MTPFLKIADPDDPGSLAEWLRSHAGDEDVPPDAEAAADFLDSLPEATHTTIIPKHLFYAIDWAIEDWSEVLFSHREDFLTDIVWVNTKNNNAR